jgi:Pyridine nucleotide-disulphide oxidoreductase
MVLQEGIGALRAATEAHDAGDHTHSHRRRGRRAGRVGHGPRTVAARPGLPDLAEEPAHRGLLAPALGLASVVHAGPVRRAPRPAGSRCPLERSDEGRGGAGYPENYASVFGLRVELSRSVTRAARSAPAGAFARPANEGAASIRPAWRPDTDAGRLTADTVVVATGANALPHTPELAAGLQEGIRQVHASQYRNPAQLPAGDVLVVGAGTSGAEIAIEFPATHRVVLAGRPTVHIPDVLFKRAWVLYWRFVSSVLTRSTPMGRRAAAGFLNRGAPLIRVSMDQVDGAGGERRGRVEGTADGWLVVEGRAVRPAMIILGHRLPAGLQLAGRSRGRSTRLARARARRGQRPAGALLRQDPVPSRAQLGPARRRPPPPARENALVGAIRRS